MNQLLLTKLAEIRNVSLERTTSLRERATSKSDAELQWMSLALQELDVAHEELRVVEEELHTQADELSATYGALEFERRRYRELFQGAPASYLVTDAAGVVLEANRLACQLLKIDTHFVIGKPLSLFIAGEDRPLMRDVLGLVVSSAEVSSFELHLLPRGSNQALSMTASVRRASGDSSPPSAFRWILHERPAARSSTNSPPAIGADPQASSQVSATEVLQQQLEHERLCRVDAERELRRRNEQLAFVAHELRNPLNATAGWLEILNQDGTGLTSREHVTGVLARNVKTLARMVDELVDQTRIVQGGVVLECEDTDFRTLFERVCDDAHGLAHAKRVQFTSRIDSDIGVVRCDTDRIQQALSNVLGNAIKFTSSEGGAVRFDAAIRGNRIECIVCDTGPGIASEHLNTIFEPFVRMDAGSESTGLGLGLNIARKLIELHGGTITAESDGPGRGATFRIQLPLTRLGAAPSRG
jgi:PAS domain S-box-containing protein